MSGVNLGVNLSLPYKFGASFTGGSLFQLGISSNTNYSSSGNSSSSSSMSFAIPKVGIELSRSFIWSEKKFIKGLNFGYGIEKYWPKTLSSSRNGNTVKVNYKGATGSFYRIKMVFREFGKIHLEPNITFRTFDLVASNFEQAGSNPLHMSLQNLQVRNIEVGVIVFLDLSDQTAK